MAHEKIWGVPRFNGIGPRFNGIFKWDSYGSGMGPACMGPAYHKGVVYVLGGSRVNHP